MTVYLRRMGPAVPPGSAGKNGVAGITAAEEPADEQLANPPARRAGGGGGNRGLSPCFSCSEQPQGFVAAFPPHSRLEQ
jgi:hypothetical protein